MPFALRIAFRALRRQPLLTSALIAIVGLAVAGSTALFSIFDGLLFRPLPYETADRIVNVEIATDTRRLMKPDDLKAATAAMMSTPLFDARGEARPAVLVEDGAADVAAWGLRPAQISPSMLRILGVTPVAGRLLTDDDRQASPARVMLSYALWQARFAGDLAIVGSVIDIPGVILRRRLELVGVLPKGFSLPSGANLWVAAGANPDLFNFARLAPMVSVDQVRAALPRVVVTPLREHVRPSGAFALGILLLATAFLLLVAWVQVASLLFARAAGRASEIGVRLALGASRIRLVRQFAVEGALIAAGSLVFGWTITPALTTAIVQLLPEALTVGQALSPDSRTLAFSLALSIAGVLILSLVPADIVRRSSAVDLLRVSGAGRGTAGAARTRLMMLGAQIAVTTMLVYMSGLALGSVKAIGEVNLGFDPDRVVAVQLPPTTVSGATSEERRAHLDRQVAQWSETLQTLRVLPGVASVAGGPLPFRSSVLFGGGGMPVTQETTKQKLLASYMPVTLDYTRVMRLEVIDGGVPRDEDLQAGPPLAMVNAGLARALAPAGPVIGQTLTVNGRAVTVAAVVADFATTRPDLPIAPAVMPLLRRPQGGYVLVRIDSSADLDRAVASIRTSMDRVWPSNPSREVMVVADLAARATAEFRARALLLGLIGALCLPLAIAGVTGALGFAVGQRTREIGIRIALGATPSEVRRAVARGGAAAAAGGVATGLAGGIVVARLTSAWLFGIGAADLRTMAIVAVVLATSMALGLAVPIWRAARVQPADALR